MIRLRTSTLEQFRGVMQTDYSSELDLLERIRRGQWADGPTNENMDAGTAWHAVLADPLRHSQIAFGPEGAPFSRYESGGFYFDAEAVHAALKHQGPGLREVTARKVFDPSGVQVEGTCDHIRGLHLRDAKMTFDTPDSKRYEPSLQWRLYCLIHGCESFAYDVCSFADPKDGYCRLKDIVSFRFWSYPQMGNDCKDWIGNFLSWASGRGLIPLLERQKRAA